MCIRVPPRQSPRTRARMSWLFGKRAPAESAAGSDAEAAAAVAPFTAADFDAFVAVCDEAGTAWTVVHTDAARELTVWTKKVP